MVREHDRDFVSDIASQGHQTRGRTNQYSSPLFSVVYEW
jgi:hypothetical protein